jgi:Myb-like DNA-binding domain
MEPRVRNLLLDNTLASPPQREDGNEFIQRAPLPFPLQPRRTDEKQTSFDTQNGYSKPYQEADQPDHPKRTSKSGVPLAKVLNSNSPTAQHGDQIQELENEEPRKKRRMDNDATRTLPKPSARKSSKRQRMPALLPPLLPPLNNPPADARIFPSMNPKSFLSTFQDLPSPLSIPTPPDREPISSQGQAEIEPEKLAKGRKGKGKKKWSDQETEHLLQGVARFGIGSWKKILQHPDYDFNVRSAVDLKDRFRTCCPDEYRKSGSARGTVESILHDALPEEGALEGKRPSAARKGPDELAKLGINGPFPKRSRRQRREFTKAEDDALLRGFIKHGAQWKKIQVDPDLVLEHRSRTDLRDRFRNRYPQRFKEAGYMHRAKQPDTEDEKGNKGKDSSAGHAGPSPSNPVAEELDFSSLLLSSGSVLEPHPSGSQNDVHHTLRLLTTSVSDQYMSDSPRPSPDLDDGRIKLSRTIFDWADQNKSQTDAEPKTLSRLDQFHINPLVAQQKLPSYPSLQINPPTFSLSRILNEPMTIPSQFDLPDSSSRRTET